MTAQTNEILIIEGQKTSMACSPDIPEDIPKIIESKENAIQGTDCWREYIGTWEIKDNRLFLNKIEGKYNLLDDQPIFASWFSGVLYIPVGKLLHYENFDFASIYEKEKQLHVREGIIVKTEFIDNKAKAAQEKKRLKQLENSNQLSPSERKKILDFLDNA